MIGTQKIDFVELGVPFPDDKVEVRFKNGDTQDIIDVIYYADAVLETQNLVGKLPKELRGKTEYDTLRNIWWFVKYNMRYKTDTPGFEKIKAPNWMLYYRVGDCKSYSVLIAALLRGLGFRYRYRFVGFDADTENPTHVYIVAVTQKGKLVILDSVHTTFDQEPPHHFELDSPLMGRAF